MSRLLLASLLGLVACVDAAPAGQSPDGKSDTVSTADTLDTAGGKQACGPMDQLLRVHHLQAKGTHNSYHVQPAQGVKDLMYTHDPLDQQLAGQGVRHFELDIHRPDDGPIRVYHIPFLDAGTTCDTLGQCLQVLKTWSDQHPCHHLLWVLVEPKDELDGEDHSLVPHWDQVDAEILAVWPRQRVLTPDDLRGSHPTVRDAVQAQGWPTLEQTRGKIAFALMPKDVHGDAYRKDHQGLKGRVMFVFGEPTEPDVAVVKRDGVQDVAEIQSLVKKGYLIRSFGDDGPQQPGGPSQLDRALQAGVHLISTDYPVEKPQRPGFRVDLPGGTPSRCNPVSAPQDCTATAVEKL